MVLTRTALIVLTAALAVGPGSARGLARQSPTAGIKVCSLLPKAEVKNLIGGGQMFDMLAPEEEAVAGGSSCNYPDVLVQVIPFSQNMLDAFRKQGGTPVSGVGDEAHLRHNPAGYAELFVKVGQRTVTLQRNIDAGQTVASVQPGVVALANALVAKLR